MFKEEKSIESSLKASGYRKQLLSAYYYWPRSLISSGAWIANDFAFYGNKLQQNQFISILYPKVGQGTGIFIEARGERGSG
jgi:hypothetical protein